MSDNVPMSRGRWRLGVLLLLASGTLGRGASAAQATTVDRGAFVQASGSVTVQPQDSSFGGYFCCDAGGTAPGVDAEAGWFLADWLSVRADVAMPAADTIHISAPRFLQDTRHRDIVVSGGAGLHPWGRERPAVIAGIGPAFERTTRMSRLLQFGPDGIVPYPGLPQVIEANDTVLAIVFGMDAPFVVAGHLSVVPQVRFRYLTRGDDARYQDGLARWQVAPAFGLRVMY